MSNIQRQYDRDALGIDWKLVAVHEPDQVSTWITYLHWHKEENAALTLLQAVGRLFLENKITVGGEQWVAYMATDVPGVLMDIACEPGMFSLNGGTFKVRFCLTRSYALASMADIFNRM